VKKRSFIIALAILAATVALLGILLNKGDENVPVIIENERPLVLGDIVVEIKGAVNKPGIYILQADARIYDLILLAGGFCANADTDALNMAAKITDGMAIFVETKHKEVASNKISINNASAEELMKLPGIGESKANSIIEYRNKNGRFYSLEDLINVSGISKNILEQIKEFICL